MADNFEGCLILATAELDQALALLNDEIRNYPTPNSGCDAQFNQLLSERQRISAAQSALQQTYFVLTPRTPALGTGVESR